MKNTNPTALQFGFAPSLFGECCVVFSDTALYALLFCDSHDEALTDMHKRFRGYDLRHNDAKAQQIAATLFENQNSQSMPALHPVGTAFQQKVWAALQQIPSGQTTTYKQIAEAIGNPKAVRAVGTAVGANPIAWLIPCHRVIREDGGMGGFRWGLERKSQMLNYEAKLAI